MFSKYSNIDIPQNYSGNRFKNANAYETTTKMHTPSDFSAVSSSVSPTYERQFFEDSSIESEYENEIYDTEDACLTCDEGHSEDISTSECNEIKSACEESDNKGLSALHDIFSKISSEDLLLISLIIFLSVDKNINNNDIIILLSILLAMQ